MNLKEVVDQLKDQQKVDEKIASNTESTSKLIKDWIKKQDRDRGDALVEKRKAARASRQPETAFAQGMKAGENAAFPNLGLLLNPATLARMIVPLTAGVAAIAAAFAGLRGWELGAIKKLQGMIKVPIQISNAVIRLRNAAYGMFGLTPAGLPERDAKGRPVKRRPITEQIAGNLRSLRTRFLRVFGLGVDGKPISIPDEDGLFKRNIIGRVTFQINRLLSPLMKVADGIAGFATGAGKNLFGFIRGNILGPVSNMFKLFGKVLWPIGFIMSLFDGVTDYINSDADGFIGRLGDGVGGFLGSLVGAPFDLLKRGISWVIRKLFGVEMNEDGTIPEGQGVAGWIVSQLESFSFEETIKKITSGIFGVVEGAVNWVKLLFSDPSEALTTLFTGTLSTLGEGITTFFDLLFWPVNTFIDWVTKSLGWREDDAPKFSLVDQISTWMTDFFEWFGSFLPDLGAIADSITSKVRSLLPDWVVDNISLTTGTTETAASIRQQFDPNGTDVAQMFQGPLTNTLLTDFTSPADMRRVLARDIQSYLDANRHLTDPDFVYDPNSNVADAVKDQTARALENYNRLMQAQAEGRTEIIDGRMVITNNNATSQAIVMSDGANPQDLDNGGSTLRVTVD